MYKEAELPKLSEKIPSAVRKLVYKLLRRDPNKRPSVSCAANVVALSLFQAGGDFRHVLSQVDLFSDLRSTSTPSVAGNRSESRPLCWWWKPESWLKLSEAVSPFAAETILSGRSVARQMSRAERQLRATFLGRMERGEVCAAVPYFLPEE